jgi:hypothetical protein
MIVPLSVFRCGLALSLHFSTIREKKEGKEGIRDWGLGIRAPGQKPNVGF